MLIAAWIALFIILCTGVVLWSCMAVSSRESRREEADEARISAAVEGAMIRELSDHNFRSAAE